MLTPRQLKNYSFTSAGRNAYRASEVDSYMEEVSRSYEQMFHENGEMVKKINLLADRLAKFRADEDNIREALMEAQRMKNNIIAQAEEEAKKELEETRAKIQEARTSIEEKTGEILDRAQQEADRIVAEARAQAEETKAEAQKNAEKKVRGAQKVSSDMLKAAQDEYDKHLGNISDQADKEREYLEKIQKASSDLRKKLLNTYSMQIELLQAGPDTETRDDVLSKFSKEDILKRPEIDDVFTDSELAAKVDYEAYASDEETEDVASIAKAVETAAPEEKTGDTAEPEETNAETAEAKAEAEAAVEKETQAFNDDLNALLQQAEEAASTSQSESLDDDDDDLDTDEIMNDINEYLDDDDDLDDDEEEEEKDEEPAPTPNDDGQYHYFDNANRDGD